MNGRYEAGVNYIKMLDLSFPEAALLPNTAALENFPGFYIKFLQVIYERLIPQKWLFYIIEMLPCSPYPSLCSWPEARVAGLRWAIVVQLFHGSNC